MGNHISHIRIAALVVLLCASCLCASSKEKKGRWSGDFSLLGGSNLVSGADYDRLFTRGETEFDAKVGYKADKWDITFNLANKYDNTVTFMDGVTYDMNATGDRYEVYIDSTVRSAYNEKALLGLVLNYRPSAANKFNFYYKWDYNLEDPQRLVETNTFNQDTDWSKVQVYKLTWEESQLVKMNYGFGGAWDHKFKLPTQTLIVKADANFLFDTRYSEWAMGNSQDEAHREYLIDEMSRETPRYKTQFFGVKSKFSDTCLGDVKGLELSGMLDILLNHNFDDLCTEKFKKQVWVDSLKFEEHFDYLTITVDPRMVVRYQVGQFDFLAEYCPEYYAYRLSSDKYFGTMQTSKLAHIGGIGASYKPSEHHSLSLSVQRSIKRPTYLNLCWFRRSGTYSNEYIEGNQDLQPETTNKAALEYGFKWGRFSATASIGDTFAYDKIEKTFNNYTIDSTSCRIYTWINAGWSNTVNGRLSARWNGKVLFAEVTGKINQVLNVNKEGNAKTNMDYNVSGQVKYMLKTWTFAVKGNYQSGVKRIYSYQTQYVGLDARVDKRFGKFGVFAEGRGLLDRPIDTITYSEDYLHGRGETAYNNKRSYLLGVRFQF